MLDRVRGDLQRGGELGDGYRVSFGQQPQKLEMNGMLTALQARAQPFCELRHTRVVLEECHTLSPLIAHSGALCCFISSAIRATSLRIFCQTA